MSENIFLLACQSLRGNQTRGVLLSPPEQSSLHYGPYGVLAGQCVF